MKETFSGIKKFFTLYVILPVIIDLIIECLNRKSLFSGLQYMIEKPSLFFFNVLIIMLTLSIAMFFQREIFVLGLISMVWFAFGIANFVILHYRVTPFSAVDFTLITSAISVSGHYLTVMNIMMIFVAVAVLLVGAVTLFKRASLYQNVKSRKGYVVSGSIVVALAFCIFLMRYSSASVQALSNSYTNISEAYENYGFVYCFANSLIDTGIGQPEEYSQELVDQVLDTLEEKKTEETPNIIVIQLESFFDVNYVKKLKYSDDPLPVFHRLQKEFSSGLLTVPTVGAGTVNTEFEILTGMSQRDFGVSEYPYKTALKTRTSDSISNSLKGLGYTSHAVHNNTGTFYGRNKVFSNLGFDDFTSIEYMNDVTLNPNGWAKDDILTEQIMKSLDSTDGSDFTFAISVQSHGKYDGIEPDEQRIHVTGAPEGKEDTFTYYVNQIYEVDQMIGNLIDQLSGRKEKTVLVLYGDHLPSLDLKEDDLINGDLYQTEYVIWDNMDLPKEDQDLNSYQLNSYVLDRIGIHEGNFTRYHQQTDWNSEGYHTGLQILEYDMLFGEQYAYDGINPFEPTNLKMGIDKVSITDVKLHEDGYLVTGTGFTPYSHIYFNSKELESEWLNENRILIKDEIRPKEDKKTLEKEEDEKDSEPLNSFHVQMQTGDGVELSESKGLCWEETAAGKMRTTDDFGKNN